MPKDTIDRAVKKGLDSDAAMMDPVTYESYGPGGSAMIIEGLTDTKTVLQLKYVTSSQKMASNLPLRALRAGLSPKRTESGILHKQ